MSVHDLRDEGLLTEGVEEDVLAVAGLADQFYQEGRQVDQTVFFLLGGIFLA